MRGNTPNLDVKPAPASSEAEIAALVQRWLKSVPDGWTLDNTPNNIAEYRELVAGYLLAQLQQARQERDKMSGEIMELLAMDTFIKGKDIPRTIEAARSVLVNRCQTAEAALQQAREALTEIRRYVDEHFNELPSGAVLALLDAALKAVR